MDEAVEPCDYLEPNPQNPNAVNKPLTDGSGGYMITRQQAIDECKDPANLTCMWSESTPNTAWTGFTQGKCISWTDALSSNVPCSDIKNIGFCTSKPGCLPDGKNSCTSTGHALREGEQYVEQKVGEAENWAEDKVNKAEDWTKHQASQARHAITTAVTHPVSTLEDIGKALLPW